MRAPSGEEYVGEFERSQRHGTCALRLIPIAPRAPSAASSARAGQGCLRSPDGTVYEGSFRHHKKHGAGFESSPCALCHTTYDYTELYMYARTLLTTLLLIVQYFTYIQHSYAAFLEQ